MKTKVKKKPLTLFVPLSALNQISSQYTRSSREYVDNPARSSLQYDTLIRKPKCLWVNARSPSKKETNTSSKRTQKKRVRGRQIPIRCAQREWRRIYKKRNRFAHAVIAQFPLKNRPQAMWNARIQPIRQRIGMRYYGWCQCGQYGSIMKH